MKEASTDTMKFEDALAELEKIVRELEDGQIGLEESLARYEQGVALLRRCHGQLRQAEQKIMTLTGQGEDEAPILKPFDHTASEAKKPRKDSLPLWQSQDGD